MLIVTATDSRTFFSSSSFHRYVCVHAQIFYKSKVTKVKKERVHLLLHIFNKGSTIYKSFVQIKLTLVKINSKYFYFNYRKDTTVVGLSRLSLKSPSKSMPDLKAMTFGKKRCHDILQNDTYHNDI